MRQVLFITLGTRDVQIDKQVLLTHFDAALIADLYRNEQGKEFPIPRKLGAFLLQHRALLESAIKTPILEPFFALMLKEGIQFERVILVATDQDSDVGERYWSNDSIEFARLLVQQLPKQFKKNVFGKIEPYSINQNVAYLDVMFQHFADAFKSRKFAFLHDVDQIHILNQGGIDAINNALMLNALYEFGEKIRLYTVNEKDRVCLLLEFAQQFGAEQEKKRVKQAISRYDYSMVKSATLDTDLSHLGAYAEARLNFDFDVASQHLNRLSTRMRSIQVRELQDLQAAKSDELSLINEVFWNTEVKLHQEAYVDFVQRFFRIIEHLAKHYCLQFLGFEGDHFRWKTNIDTYLNKPENSQLLNHLDNYQFGNGKKLEYDKANIEVYMAILELINPSVFNYLKRIKPLKDMRNQGVGAHGFAPISLRTILDTLGLSQVQDLFELMNELKDFLQIDADSPFERVNAHLLKLV